MRSSTAGGPDLAEHHANGGAFARAIVTQQAVDVSGGNLQAQVVDRESLAEFLEHVFKADHCFL